MIDLWFDTETKQHVDHPIVYHQLHSDCLSQSHLKLYSTQNHLSIKLSLHCL